MTAIPLTIRLAARVQAAEVLLLDLVEHHFPTRAALDAWAQAAAGSADPVVDARTLIAEDPRYQEATAYRDALGDLLATARRHWGDRHPDRE